MFDCYWLDISGLLRAGLTELKCNTLILRIFSNLLNMKIASGHFLFVCNLPPRHDWMRMILGLSRSPGQFSVFKQSYISSVENMSSTPSEFTMLETPQIPLA